MGPSAAPTGTVRCGPAGVPSFSRPLREVPGLGGRHRPARPHGPRMRGGPSEREGQPPQHPLAGAATEPAWLRAPAPPRSPPFPPPPPPAPLLSSSPPSRPPEAERKGSAADRAAEAANRDAGRSSRPRRPSHSACGGGETMDGIGWAKRRWPPAHREPGKKNDGSAEAQKARGETPARPLAPTPPRHPIRPPRRGPPRRPDPPRRAGGRSGGGPSGGAYRAGGAVRLRL